MVFLLAVHTRPAAASSGEVKDFVIGLDICLSGVCAEDGDYTLKAAQLAAEELNSRGGVLGRLIRFAVQDGSDAVSGVKAVTAYRNLRLNKDINYFIGPTWTPGGLALAPIVAREPDVIITSPSLGAAEYHKAGDNIFNSRGADEICSRRMAHYAFERGWKRAAIISTQQPWEMAKATAFEEEFRKIGGVTLIRVEPQPDIDNLRTESIKVLQSRPDVVFISTMVRYAVAARELRRLNYTGPKLVPNIDQPRIMEAQGAAEGTVLAVLVEPSDWFKERFGKRFNLPATPISAIAYDTVLLYAKAIEQSGTFEPTVVRKAILSLELEGASGRLRFDKEGGALRDPLLRVVRGENLVALP